MNFSGKKVLMVEDVRSHREIVRNSLIVMGFTVIEAGTKRHALEQVALESFDFAIVDVDLDGSKGFEGIDVVKAIHDKDCYIPIMYFSGMSDDHFNKAIIETKFAKWQSKIPSSSILHHNLFQREIEQFFEQIANGNLNITGEFHAFIDLGERKIPMNKIAYISSSRLKRNKTIIFTQHISDKCIESNLTLNQFEEQLKTKDSFLFRVHKSNIVNLHNVVCIYRPSRNVSAKLLLRINGTEELISIGSTYYHATMKKIGM